LTDAEQLLQLAERFKATLVIAVGKRRSSLRSCTDLMGAAREVGIDVAKI
jgi:Holliday junction resolvase